MAKKHGLKVQAVKGHGWLGFFIFEFLWLLVRTNGFGMSKDGYGRSRGWRWWRRQQLEDWVSGCLVVVVAARSAWLWMIF